MNSTRITEIETRLAIIEVERVALVEERVRLEKAPVVASSAPDRVHADQPTPEEKADLFLKLFGARESVYPRLWENPKTGKKGYAPACRNEWVRGVCEKPKIKCSECTYQAFPPLDREAVMDHLRERHTIGTYAIREDNTCVFLVADFDGHGWQKDILAYKRAAESLGVPVTLERSRSK